MPNNRDYEPPLEAAPGDENILIRAGEFEPARETALKPPYGLRMGVLMSSLCLLVGGAVLGFVLTSKSLSLEVYPPAAEVSIQGIHLKWADRVLLRQGEYPLRITAPGYFPLEEVLTVGEAQNQQRAFFLRKLPGQLRITTTPVKGARVEMDGEEQGRTPLTLRDLAPGEYRIRVSAARYLPTEETLEIEGKGNKQQLDIALTPAWADLTVKSQPAGADLYVDAKRIGSTPLTAEILQGKHTLQLRHPGYKVWQAPLTLAPQEAVTLPTIELEPADAVVHLESEPSRASVLIAGEYQGQTPLELALPPGETVTLQLFKEGYQETSQTLSLNQGEKKRFHVDLEPEWTPVEISTDPPDAQLYVDGVSQGKASQTLKLTARPHQIVIRKAGYVDYETTLVPRLGIAQQLRASLKTVEQARLDAIKPRIETATGQTLKLFRPQETFTMGASRRQPGRRANETLYSVKLTRPFYLSRHEVTNREFKAYDPEHSSGRLRQHALNTPEQPVVNITWEQAARYCNWLSAQDSLPPFYVVEKGRIVGFNPDSHGYRLPTEAEWAWAARTDGDKRLKFPWGEAFPPPPQSGNYADESAAGMVGSIIEDYHDGFAVSAPVGRFPPNAKGLFDLGGNVAEWVHDVYEIKSGDHQAAAADPLGPDAGQYHVIRGSSWAHGTLTELRLSFRDYDSEAREDVGFRIARYLEE